MIVMKNKKGVSEIISTVLIVVITIAAVAIIGAVIIPMIRNNLQVSGECSAAEREISIITSEGFTCKDVNGATWIQVQRGSGDYELIDIRIKGYTNTGDSIEGINGAELATALSVKNSVRRQLVTDDSISAQWKNVTQVEVVPVVQIGNSPRDCSGTGKVKISTCVV